MSSPSAEVSHRGMPRHFLLPKWPWLAAAAGLALAGGLLVAATNAWMLRTTRPRIYSRTDDVPKNDMAIVLGTAPTLRNGSANPFFVGRMEAAAALFHAGRVSGLLLSGDNSRKDYDEPSAMRAALLARGVPAEAINLDYAGFRTLDTMARARAVFGLRRCTVVTDDFHLARSLYLADAHGIAAVGCRSHPGAWRWSKKTRLREVVSRTMAWLDVHVLGTKPKFYGPPVALGLAPTPGK